MPDSLIASLCVTTLVYGGALSTGAVQKCNANTALTDLRSLSVVHERQRDYAEALRCWEQLIPHSDADQQRNEVQVGIRRCARNLVQRVVGTGTGAASLVESARIIVVSSVNEAILALQRHGYVVLSKHFGLPLDSLKKCEKEAGTWGQLALKAFAERARAAGRKGISMRWSDVVLRTGGRLDAVVPFLQDAKFLREAPWLSVVQAVLGIGVVVAYASAMTALPRTMIEQWAKAYAPSWLATFEDQSWHRDQEIATSAMSAEKQALLSTQHALAVFVPLVDTSLELGPTELIPDSHLDRTQGIRDRASIVPQLKKGEVLIYDLRTYHRGLRNNGKTPRAALRIVYMKSEELRPLLNIAGSYGDEPLMKPK